MISMKGYETFDGISPISVELPNKSGLSWREIAIDNKHEVLAYCSVFISFGLCAGFLGPTLWDLSCQTDTILTEMVWVFGTQTFTTLVGTILGGPILKCMPAHWVLLISVSVISATLLSVSWCVHQWSLTMILAVMGLAMGVIDTTANCCMLTLFGREVAPLMMTLHFCYAMGALMAPVVSDPFLFDFDCTSVLGLNEKDYNKRSLNSTQLLLKRTLAEDEKLPEAFYVMAGIQIPIILLLITLIGRGRNGHKGLESHNEIKESRKTGCEASGWCGSIWAYVCKDPEMMGIMAIAAGLLFLSDGIQATFGGYVFTFTRQEVPDVNAADSDFIDIAFWGGFSFGRFCAIFLSMYYAPTTLLLIDTICLFVSMTSMVVLPANYTLFLVGTTLSGVFLASISPSVISAAEQLFNLDPITTSMLVVSATFGETVYPLFVGNYMGESDASIFLIVTSASGLALFLMLLLFIICAAKRHRHSRLCYEHRS